MSEHSSSYRYRRRRIIHGAIVGMLVLVLALGVGCDAVFGLELPESSGSADAGTTDGGLQDGGAPDAGEGRTKRVFLTSAYSNGNFGGIAGADAKCNALATAVGLSGQFLAWLSDATLSPASRMTRTPGPYALVNGLTIASSWEDLTDGSLAWPIAADELGMVPINDGLICAGGEVWSNTTAAGESLIPSCGDWTSNATIGSVGNFTQTQARWTHDMLCPSVSCSSSLRFYCFEQ